MIEKFLNRAISIAMIVTIAVTLYMGFAAMYELNTTDIYSTIYSP